ncbi:MAG: hypothetical protein WBW56_10565, partial [Syntrophobacteraceae bacterium]
SKGLHQGARPGVGISISLATDKTFAPRLVSLVLPAPDEAGICRFPETSAGNPESCPMGGFEP